MLKALHYFENIIKYFKYVINDDKYDNCIIISIINYLIMGQN